MNSENPFINVAPGCRTRHLFGGVFYHCDGNILCSPPSILPSETHTTVLRFNPNWRPADPSQDTQEEEKEFCVLILLEEERSRIMRPLKNINRSLQLDFKNQLGHYSGRWKSNHRTAGSSRGEVRKKGFNRITDIFIMSENSIPLKGSSGLLHRTVKLWRALQISSEKFVLGLVVLSSD